MRLSRDRLVDLILGVAVTTVVAVAITADIAGSRPPDVVAYVFAVGLGALMLARRDFPVPVLALTAVGIIGYHLADYPPVGLALPAAAALYSAAERDKLWWAIGIGGALLLISVVGRLREGDDPSYLLGYELAWTVMIMAAAIALGDNVRVRRLWRAEQSRREELAAAEREREAARRIESERVRIARELHDVLAHTVAVVSMQADVATEALEDDPGATRDALRTIRTASSDVMRELRSMLGVLRNAPDAHSLEPAGSLRNLPSSRSSSPRADCPSRSGWKGIRSRCRVSSTRPRTASCRKRSRTPCVTRRRAGSTSSWPTNLSGWRSEWSTTAAVVT